MNQKIIVILFFIFIYIITLIFNNSDNTLLVTKIVSPTHIELDNKNTFILEGFDNFDDFYSYKNSKYSKHFGITEDEAFIIGNFGKYWTFNLLSSRKVKIRKGDLIYYKFGYKTKFENSAYCIKEYKMCNEQAFKKLLNSIQKGKYVLVDIDSDTIYPIAKSTTDKVKNYVIVRKTHVKSLINPKKTQFSNAKNSGNWRKTQDNKMSLDLGDMKLYVSDFTSKLHPDRNCSSLICKEILNNINIASKTIDMAIYGYSSIPDIENAIMKAKERGVRIRLVYDTDSLGKNIYPDTDKMIELIPNNKSDSSSQEVSSTMHNKFYIFDDKILITGSANLSHTDMSGFNSNSIIVINSEKIAKIYKQEFEQMYNGHFHNSKKSFSNNNHENIKIFFSPQDKGIQNGIIPIIRQAKKYIYIPSFIITEKHILEELINAQKRGIDVKIIIDSLNATNKHSKHRELRNAGIKVKAENYAGKMHSKSMIVDDEYLIIGSMNFSYSGENKNDENIIIMKNPKMAVFYKNFFLYQWNKIPDKWLKYTPRAESKDSIGSCSDGIDNNYDGLIDKDDLACK